MIEVRSVLFQDGEPNDIKDIKPIIGAGLDWQRYLKWILLGLATLAAVGGFFLVGQATEKTCRTGVRFPSQILNPMKPRLAELERLLARKLIENGQFREHYFELSEIFRRYLGSLLSIPALDWTTEEIGAYVSRYGKMDASTQKTILSLLPATDRSQICESSSRTPNRAQPCGGLCAI